MVQVTAVHAIMGETSLVCLWATSKVFLAVKICPSWSGYNESTQKMPEYGF